MSTLGTLEELPLDYRKTLEDEHHAPLWPMLRNVLPHDAPRAADQACLWAYQRDPPVAASRR